MTTRRAFVAFAAGLCVAAAQHAPFRMSRPGDGV
jgi:hypothetical protein